MPPRHFWFLYRLDESVREPCCYHTGVYRAWWSCCKEPLRGARGCRTGVHVEDVGYTRMLDSMCMPATDEPVDDGTVSLVEGPDGRIMAVAGIVVTQPAITVAPPPAAATPPPAEETTPPSETETPADDEPAEGEGR